MSIQWALPMLPSLLPQNLMDRLQEVSVDPHYVFPKSGNTMPVYDVSTGELLKVAQHGVKLSRIGFDVEQDTPLVEMIRVSRRKMRALCAGGLGIRVQHTFLNILHGC